MNGNVDECIWHSCGTTHLCFSEMLFNQTKTSFPYTGPREGPGDAGWDTEKLSSRAG